MPTERRSSRLTIHRQQDPKNGNAAPSKVGAYFFPASRVLGLINPKNAATLVSCTDATNVSYPSIMVT